ncbi:MAG: hypothetical protein OEV42_13675, partial [Deltaproteobacteria bacterium]|nr:hypothetical protein [Deltaproteobacteria bacterium]
TGAANSRMNCPACHNPHGESYGADIPTIRMTRGAFEIQWRADDRGEYGIMRNSSNILNTCKISCHFDNSTTIYKYYRTHTIPVLTAISVTDANPADPLPAEAGYTNESTVEISFIAGGEIPTEMQCAEDISFSANATGWITYLSPHTYSLSGGDGSRTVYCQLRGTGGSSHVKSASIILDRISPTVAANALTSPNGLESWLQNTNRNITWSAVSDDNLKDLPISLHYSMDSGASYPNSIAAETTNSGVYNWTLPVIQSNNLRVKLSAFDKAGNFGTDSSDADFAIQPAPPLLGGISISDNDSTDPEPAETGYTNSQSVNLVISASNNPTEMILAEDSAFSINSTGWIPFSANYVYSLSAANGLKRVYSKVRNSAGESAFQSNTIILDTMNPSMLSSTLTSPNGGEFWPGGSAQNITWNSGDISDANLKTTPLKLSYSWDGGSSYTQLILMTNDGSRPWTLPSTASHKAIIKITAYDKAGNLSEDTSDGIFFITPPSAYIVTHTNDDYSAGSLRQAIANLEADGGNNAIWFNIPAGSLTNGVAIFNQMSALPQLTKPDITIDGESQTSLQGDTNSNGPEIRFNGLCSGFTCLFDSTLKYTNFSASSAAANITIRNIQFTLFWTAFHSSAGGTVLTGNHFGFTSDNLSAYSTAKNEVNVSISADATIGGINSSDRNYISCANSEAIDLSGSGSRIINNVIGLMPDWTLCANNTSGPAVHFGGSNGFIENNVIAGSQSGIRFKLGASNNQVKGNTFDTYYNAGTWHTISAGGQTYSINIGDLLYANNNTIGGPDIAASDSTLNDSNVFSSSHIAVYNYKGNNTAVMGNFFGTNPGQNQILKGNIAIETKYTSNIVIGGEGAGQAGNIIANMSTYGINLNSSNSLRIKMSRNSFYNNGDNIDDDAIYLLTGANNNIARPAITAASTSTVNVSGVSTGDRVEVYLSDYDGTGTEFGEGKRFIGSAVTVGTTVDVPVTGVIVNDWVTAITIQTDNDTSAFSANFQVQ